MVVGPINLGLMPTRCIHRAGDVEKGHPTLRSDDVRLDEDTVHVRVGFRNRQTVVNRKVSDPWAS